MSRIPEFLQGLLFAQTEAAFRAHTESLVRGWNGECAAAITHFFRLSGYHEGKIIILETLLHHPPEDPKGLLRFLSLASQENESRLKNAVLDLCARIPTAMSFRLLTVFTHSDESAKQLAVLKALAVSGVSLFVKELLENFEKHPAPLQEGILEYLESIPELTAGEKSLFEEKLALLAGELEDSGSAQEFFRRILPARLRFGLSFKKIFAKILKRKTGLARLTPDELEDLSNVWESRKITRTREDAWELLMGDETVYSTAVFDRVFRERIALLLPEKIAELGKASHEELHKILNRLRRMDLLVAPILVGWLRECGKVSLQQILMEHLLLFRFPEDLAGEYQKLCEESLRDQEHVRIFETAVRNLVVRFGHRGLDAVLHAFEKISDAGHKAVMLQGLLHALEDHGMARRLSSADLVRIHHIAGNVSDHLRHGEPNDILFRHLCHLTELLHISTYESEMIELSKRHAQSSQVLSALVDCESDASFRKVIAFLESSLENPQHEWEKVLAVFAALCERNFKTARLLDSGLLKRFLLHPYFSGAVVRFLSFYQRPELREHIFPLARRGDLAFRVHAMEFLFQLPPESAAREAIPFFHAREDFSVRDLGAFLLAFDEDPASHRKVGRYLILEKKDPGFADAFFLRLAEYPEIRGRNGRAFLGFRKAEGFKAFRSLAEKLALELFGDDDEGLLPLDEVLN